MNPGLRVLAAAGAAFLAAMTATGAACAQKSGGILRVHLLDSPPSLSMHEEVDANPARAAMGIFNNLAMFDQHAKQNNMQSIIRSGHRLVLERGSHPAYLPIARGG